MSKVSTLAASERGQRTDHRAVAERIRKYGLSVTMVGAGPCPRCAELGQKCDGADIPFAYTTGLFSVGHPELLIFHDSPAGASSLLTNLARRVFDGDTLAPGQYVEYPGTRHRGYIEDLPNPGQIVFASNAFYRRPADASVPVLQITFSDHTGRFPWDRGFDGDPSAQPRPGTFRA